MTVHIDLSRDYDLEAAHIARISRIFQAILIAFQKEFEEKSIDDYRIRRGFIAIAAALLVTAAATHYFVSE